MFTRTMIGTRAFARKAICNLIWTLSIASVVAGSLAGVASADTIDRINACEQQGGGACVFNILRELASAPSGQPFPFQTGLYKDGSTDNWYHRVTRTSAREFNLYWGDVSTQNGPAKYTCQAESCTTDHPSASSMSWINPSSYIMGGVTFIHHSN